MKIWQETFQRGYFKLIDKEECKGLHVSRINWLAQGEINTKFFHALMNWGATSHLLRRSLY